MIDKDLFSGKVAAIIDWECAGWLPGHWEYCKTVCWLSWVGYNKEWRDVYVPKFLSVFQEEAEADRILQCEFDHTD